MLRKLKAMFRNEPKPAHKPDAISAKHTIAIQRNERASHAVQEALEEMLARNDELRGSKK